MKNRIMATRAAQRLLACSGIVCTLLGCTPLPTDNGSTGSAALKADASMTSTEVSTTTNGPNLTLDATASSEGIAEIVSYRWISAGQDIASGETADISLSPGQHEIILIVEDAVGNTDVDRIYITVSGDANDEFVLTLRVVGEGSIEPDPGSYNVRSGTQIDLFAIPKQGHQFVRWSGGVNSAASATNVVMDRDRTITAEFVSLTDGTRPVFFLPFGATEKFTVSQGNLGEYTHFDHYAWDWGMDEGTPVVASAAGRVIAVKEDTLPNPPDTTIITEPANYVTIDHGAGLQTIYAHLDTLSVIVEPGQYVARGQVIGYSGDTGFSSGPHLHYEVLDVLNRSMPSSFWDYAPNDGIPNEGDVTVSSNELSLETVEGYAPSRLPHDAFAINNVELTGFPPPAHFLETDTDYQIDGIILDDMTRACFAVVDGETYETLKCDIIDAGEDGSFTIPFRLDETLLGQHYVGVITGKGDVEGIVPIPVLIVKPVDFIPPPVVSIEEPTNDQIEFLQSRKLIGTVTTTRTEASLTYRWAQVSGPPADILDPFAPQTSFSLPFGAGSDRVAFQLIAFDGVKHSQPASVSFFMEDTFYVRGIGVGNESCDSAATCPAENPPIIEFSQGVMFGWVEVLNAEIDDTLTFEVVNPSAQLIRTAELVITDEPNSTSFWRFAWNTQGMELRAGEWAGILKRNGETEASIAFRVAP